MAKQTVFETEDMGKTSLELARKQKGTGTAVSVDLKEFPELLEAIREAARDDDREVSNWLRRRLVKLSEDGVLFGK